MTRLFLHFCLEFSCYIQNLVIRQKKPVSEICVGPFSNIGNWITFGPLRIRCLLYIWTTLLITVHTFAVVTILPSLLLLENGVSICMCSAVEVACLAQNFRHSSTRVWLHLQWGLGVANNNVSSYLMISTSLCWVW